VAETIDILVIDDNQHQLNFITRLLNFHGFKTQSLKRSKDALSKIKEISPKLIVLDIMMPELDGFSLLKQIRENKKLAMLPIVIFSSKTFPVDIQKAKKLGANSYICKPSKGAVLIDEIKKYI